MTEVWTRWEGQVVNGVYPLRRFLNASSHSAVFLTESATEGFLNAAIKIIPTDAAANEVQLWHWKTATTFHHPHLIALLDSGTFEIQGRYFLFVVMEYAEENLAQILPYRALSPDEVRELFVPALDALAFLHRENWVQGQLKPSNVLVVDDQIKLAIDTIRPIGMPRTGVAHSTIYDAPESDQGEVSSAGDVWSLGVTLAEALTQYAPSWPEGKTAPAVLPSNLPAEFNETIQRCLSVDPRDRPTVAELQVQTSPRGTSGSTATVRAPSTAARGAAVGELTTAGGPAAVAATRASPGPAPAGPSNSAGGPSAGPRTAPIQPANSEPEPVMRATPHTFSPSLEESERSGIIPRLLALAVVLIAVWGGWHWYHGRSTTPSIAPENADSASEASEAPVAAPPALQPPTTSTPPAVAPPPTSATAPAPATTQAAEPAPAAATAPPAPSAAPRGKPSEVVHEEIPKASPSARSTIHGHVKVLVHVWVDRSGNVVRSELEHPSSSSYFNRLASQAARKWTFSPAGTGGTRNWVIQFEFGRDGSSARTIRHPS